MQTPNPYTDPLRETSEMGCPSHAHSSQNPTINTMEKIAARADAEFIGWGRRAAEELIRTLGAARTVNSIEKHLYDSSHLDEASAVTVRQHI